MKNLLTIIAVITLAVSCEKNPPSVSSTSNANQASAHPIDDESLAPYGKISNWKCIGGDTTFSQNLSLKLYYIEKAQGCNVYYYELSYPIWSEYEYSHSVSSCISQTDTLTINDFNTNNKVKFIRIKRTAV